MIDVPEVHPNAVRFAERAHAQSVIQTILVVVDPTATVRPSIDKAARLAASFGSTVELLICDADETMPESWAGGTTTQQYRDLVRERRLADLELLARPLRARGIQVSTASYWHAPLERGIVEHAIRIQADLVVKDTHEHAAATPMPPVRTDWVLIRQVPMPLLLVRAAPWPFNPCVALSVDPCHEADRPVALDESIVALGSCFGRALAGDVQVLHALRSPPHLEGEGVSDRQKDALHAHDRTVVERLAEHRHGFAAPVRYVEKSVPEGILELVSSIQPSILVMGSAGRPRFQNSASSTAAQVLERTNCDLLVIKPPGFISPVLVTDR